MGSKVMQFRVGDKVRLTQDWARAIAGMEGEVVFPETESNIPLIRFPGWAYGHDGRLQIGSRSPLPEGSTEGLFTPGEYLELIPPRLEKPMEYEIGGTLTDARGIVREIKRVSLAVCNLVIQDGSEEWVDPSHYKYHPPVKPVTIKPGDPLWEALEGFIQMAEEVRYSSPEYKAMHAAWAKAKEAAK